MAKFNPDIPESAAPSYLGLSKPIDQFEGDRSKGVLFKGIGDFTKDAFTAADTVVKSIIDDAIYKRVDTQREATTGALEEMAGIPPNLRVADIQPTGEQSGATLLPQQLNVPATVDEGVDQAGTLVQAGRASPGLRTYYSGRLDLIAKDIRSQYPGYREYIDKKIESITGMNPANQVISDLMSLINQQGANSKSELDKAVAFVVARAGVEGGPIDPETGKGQPSYVLMQLLKSGAYRQSNLDPMTFVMQWYSRHDATKAKNDQIIQNHHTNQAITADLKVSATESLTQLAVNKQAEIWGDNMQVAGVSFKKWDDFVSKVTTDASFRNSPQLIQAATVMLQQLEKAKRSVITQSQMPGPNNKPSIWVSAGDGGQAAVDRGFAQTETFLKRIIGKEDMSLIGRTGAFNDAALRDTGSKLFSDPDIGPRVLGQVAIAKYGGSQYAAALASRGIFEGFDNSLKQWFTGVKDLMLDPSLPNFNTSAAVKKANETAHIGKNPNDPTNTNPRANWQQERAVYDEILKFPGSVLSNPKVSDPIKIDQAKKNFSPTNYGLISKFEKNGPDQIRAYQFMTDKNSVVLPLKQLSKSDPTVWEEAKDWTDHEFRNEIFKNQINKLGEYATIPNMQIVYNPETHHWTAIDMRRAEINQFSSNDPFSRYVQRVQTDLDKLNKGIDGVANYMKEDKQDVNAYVLRIMVEAGLDPKRTVGIPGEMMATLITAGQPQKDTFGTKSKTKQQVRVQ